MNNPDLVSRTASEGHEDPVVTETTPDVDHSVDSAGPLLDAKTNTAAATWALFLGIGLLMLGNGLQATLIGVRTQVEGFSQLSTGLVMAAYFAGFLFGTRAVQVLLNAVGHIRVFAALASLSSVVVLVYSLTTLPATWVFMRFMTGFAMSGLFVVAESWINDLATNKTRARLMAVYMVVTMAAMSGGQFLLNAADPAGFRLFIMASVLVSMSLVPITLSATSAPPAATPTPMAITELVKVVPTGLVMSFLIGLSTGALMGMGAVYATAVGLSTAQVTLFVSAPLIGGMVFQLPIGWLADHVARRGVILSLAVIGVVSSLGLYLVSPGSLASYGLLLVIGGMNFPLYSLAIAYTNDWLRPDQILGASAALVGTNGLGAIVGPLVTAGVFFLAGVDQYFGVQAVSFGLLALYVAYRIATRDGLPVDAQDPYVPFPARASAVAANLILRRRSRATRPPTRRT